MVIKRNATPKKAKKQKEESVLDDEAVTFYNCFLQLTAYV